MAIIRCNHCNYIREVPNEHIGKTIKCPVCEQAAPIHDTIIFINKVIEKYNLLVTKCRQLESKTPKPDIQTETMDQEIDLHNTTAMTNKAQYKPIIDWFERHQILVDVDLKALDTQGFFDEVAVELGDNYEILQDILDKMRKTQRNKYSSLVINISSNNQKEIKFITGFCRSLYDYAFVAKYFYNKTEKKIHLTLQSAPLIVNFFNGEWLEWYVFMKLLKLFYDKKCLFSALRSFKINFPNEDVHEIDIFFLINGHTPLFIECKSGEFRSMIEKYNIFRKKLKIEKSNFFLLVLGLSDEQTAGLSKMHDITFVNERNFITQIAQLPL